MYQKLIKKQTKLALVGLGYVGLPIALEFAKTVDVIGFDINETKLEKMRLGIDPSRECPNIAFENKNIEFTSSLEKLKEASFFIVAVPTPIDEHHKPDLSPLLSATRTVAAVLKRGDYVVYESTVYPGCTEEDCVPILEKVSGLKVGLDFKIGYSPERINPGDKVNTLTNTVKIVSGYDKETLENIAKVYEIVVEAGVHLAPSIKVAEAAKIIENTQRDVNIALMNELSIIFSRMQINTYDVIEAAGTKWNFLQFYPGFVGGHCIGVDPYYLEYKAKSLKYHPQLISAGRFINDSMGGYFAKKIVKKMISLGKNILGSRVLIMGITFKENVSDIRNSKVVDMYNEFVDYGVNVDVVDPYADTLEVKQEYGIDLLPSPMGRYDSIIIAVGHKEYRNMCEKDFSSISLRDTVIGDVKGLYKGKINTLNYFSL